MDKTGSLKFDTVHIGVGRGVTVSQGEADSEPWAKEFSDATMLSLLADRLDEIGEVEGCLGPADREMIAEVRRRHRSGPKGEG